MRRAAVRGLMVSCAAVLSVWRVTAQQSPLSIKAVQSAPAIDLALPAQDPFVADAFVRVLTGAGVPFGVESPAPPVDGPRVDLGRPIVGRLSLGGRRLDAALDALSSAAPGFRWSEGDGVVVVRPVAGAGSWLDRVVPNFAVDNVPVRDAFDALLETMGRPPSPKPPAGRSMASSARPLRRVSVNLDHASVLAILNAIVRGGAGLFWTVSYDAAPATEDTSRLTIGGAGESLLSPSPVVMRDLHGSSVPANVWLAVADIESMARAYAEKVGIKIGIEPLATARGPGPVVPTVLPFTVSRDPAAALGQIIAYDGRFGWSGSNGFFHVAPRSNQPGRVGILDLTVPTFVAEHEALASVLERIILTLGSHSTGGSMSRGSMPNPRGLTLQETIAEAQAIPVTFTIDHSTTLRDVLDEMCRAYPPLSSWALRVNALDGTRLELYVSSTEGWGFGRTFTLAGRR